MSKRSIVNIGDRYGKLTVIGEAGYYITPKNKRVRLVECVCDCGTRKTFRLTNLKTGGTVSCGCHKREVASNSYRCHHLKNTRIYRIWCNMKSRCYNKANEHYHLYGGRNIKVCRAWRNSFMSFYKWAVSNGYEDSLSIDRIDCNGNYEPQNCRWANQKTQCRNRNNTVFVLLGDIKIPVIGFCEIFGLDYGYVMKVLNKMKHKYTDFISMKEKESTKEECKEFCNRLNDVINSVKP